MNICVYPQASGQPDIEVLEESALAMAQSVIQKAIDESGITRAEVARRMDRNRSFISRMLSGSHNLTVKTMARSLAACGFEVRFQRVPVASNWGEAPVSPRKEALPAHAGSAMLASKIGEHSTARVLARGE